MGKSVARLYEQFQPENYQLHLIPDREAMTFSGSVTVRGKKAGRPSKRIAFHQKDLKVTSATIIKHDKKGDLSVALTRINNQGSLDEVRLHSSDMIYPGEYTITMEFQGKITRPMNGIYPAQYKHDGADKKLIVTQFESHHAREAFPCIDEPEAKATFDLTLTTPKGETVLANTPARAEKVVGNVVETSFETTPKMSTYLLAFAYGELDYQEAKTKNGVCIRTYATPDNAQLANFSVGTAVKCLEFFEDYFGLPYPLPKLDMLAVPDFSSAAMENWGLVTYRNSVLLIDEATTSIETKQLCAEVIAHELSHQWFGNLVTMKWWDDLWLNESFANMMAYLAVDSLYPEWHIWEQFVSHETVSAKRRDSLVDVQAVRTPVNHPDELGTLFDPSIVYAKGGSLLYMLMNHIGQDAFREGLASYFAKHSYKNTEADDLWQELGKASGQDIKTFMGDWLTRPGYPLVNVDWQPGATDVKLTQRRFLSDPELQIKADRPWHVPLAPNYEFDKQTLVKTTDSVKLKSSAMQSLLLNHDGKSYFLPHYTQSSHLQDIVNSIRRNEVNDVDRFLLLDNYVLLQRGGEAATTELLDLLKAYEDESSVTVWGAMAASIAEARRLVENDDKLETKLDDLIQNLVLSLAESLGWDDKPNDTANTLRLRATAMSIAAGAKSKTVIDAGLARFREFKKPGDLPASTRTVVYYCGARFGNDKDFDKLMDLYKSIQNADELDEIASGITSAKEPSRFQQSIELLKTDTIRRQDLMHWYVWLLRNRHSRGVAWQWLQDNWEWVEKEFSSDKSYGYFARFCGGVFSRQSELDEFNAFFSPKKSILALERDITLAEQEIKSRVGWRNRNEADVKSWLKQL